MNESSGARRKSSDADTNIGRRCWTKIVKARNGTAIVERSIRSYEGGETLYPLGIFSAADISAGGQTWKRSADNAPFSRSRISG